MATITNDLDTDMEQRYQERLARYTCAMRNGQPDMVPIRPFVAEFTGTYAGYTSQQLAHDYNLAFDAACKCAADFDWDAVVGNMVYVWTGLTQGVGIKYYGVPGLDIPPETGFQYREPPAGQEFMMADEYDRLIEDPTRFLYEVWLPRASKAVQPTGAPVTYEHDLALVRGGMAMMQYFSSFPAQGERLRRESGTAGAIAGILKAPLDIIADKLRGYLGLVDDLLTQPDKVLAACEALAPHLYHAARSGADPTGNAPVSFWMHRSCVPFITPKHFQEIFWPTFRPIIESLWTEGIQTLFYAEGNWDYHLETFAELPEQSIIYHVDQGDLAKAHRVLGDRFCLSGGLSNVTLAYGTPEKVTDEVKRILDIAAADGGYIMDASAIMQNESKVENVRAMTEATRKYGVYGTSPRPPKTLPSFSPAMDPIQGLKTPTIPAGTCKPWPLFRQDLPESCGEEEVFERVWGNIDGLANLFIWHMLLSF